MKLKHSYRKLHMNPLMTSLNHGGLLHLWRTSVAVYFNKANVAEPGWQASFYGTQYRELLHIKRNGFRRACYTLLRQLLVKTGGFKMVIRKHSHKMGDYAV